MKNRLRLADDLTLPLEAVTETIAVLGIRGSGKSNTATVFAEELLAHGQQIVVVDPTDVWWGLKSSQDGEAAGYPVVVLGGKRGDLPLAPESGAAIADFVVDERASVILSLRRFASRGEQKRFTTDFARRLYARKGEQDQPTPLHLFVDEASLFVPQRVGADEAQMVGAFQQIVRQGRSSGFGVSLIDQRAASVNKDVLTQLEVLIAHRTTSPQDRKALREWVEQHDTGDHGDEFLSSLASLPRGTAWVWSPGWLDLFQRVPIRAARTFDSRRTPKPGEVAVTPRQVASVDLDALRARLAASIARAKADDPKALKARIAELEHEVRARDVTAERGDVVPVDLEDAIAAAVQRGRDEERERQARYRHVLDTSLDRVRAALPGAGELEAIAERLTAVGSGVREAREALAGLHENIEDDWMPAASAAPATPALATVARDLRGVRFDWGAAPTPTRAPRAVAPADGLTRPQQEILDAIAALNALGIAQPSRANVGVWLGKSSDAGGFKNDLGRLRSAGLLEYPTPGDLALTGAGCRLAHAVAPSSLAELHARWFERLSGPQGDILRAVLRAYPRKVTREALGRALNKQHDAGGFKNDLGRLRSLHLIDYPEPGSVAATALLFPQGLR